MNSTVASTSLFLAAAASYPVLLVSAVAAALIATFAGVLSVFVIDYGRIAAPAAVPAKIIPFRPARGAAEALREAA